MSISMKSLLTVTFNLYVLFEVGHILAKNSPEIILTGSSKSAYSLYHELILQDWKKKGRELKNIRASGNLDESHATFGCEKEGSSPLITNIAGPSASFFIKYVQQLDGTFSYSQSYQRQFLLSFLYLVQNGIFVEKSVENLKNEKISIDITYLNDIALAECSTADLKKFFVQWVDQTANSPFSFLSSRLRREIYRGTFPGTNSKRHGYLHSSYTNWVALHGQSEKYIEQIVPQSKIPRWEINSKVMDSYGEFEKMLEWFRHKLDKRRNKVRYYPGHNRIVFRLPEFDSIEQRDIWSDHLGETLRGIQSYVVLNSLLDKKGLELSSWKRILLDQDFKNLKSWKGVIRLERNRWGNNTMGVEFRSGTKNKKIRKFVERIFLSRALTNDWGKIKTISSYTLVPYLSFHTYFETGSNYKPHYMNREVADRFDLSATQVDEFFRIVMNLHAEEGDGGEVGREVDLRYLVPIWYFENAPFISSEKANSLKELTRFFILRILKINNRMNIQLLREHLSQWIESSQIIHDLQNYLSPTLRNDQLLNMKKITSEELGLEILLERNIRKSNSTFISDDGEKFIVGKGYDLDQETTKNELSSYSRSLMKLLGTNKALLLEKKRKVIVVDKNGGFWTIRIIEKISNDRVKKDFYKLSTPITSLNSKLAKTIFKFIKLNGLYPAGIDQGSSISFHPETMGKDSSNKLAHLISYISNYRVGLEHLFKSHYQTSQQELCRFDPKDKSMQRLLNFEGTHAELQNELYNQKYFNKCNLHETNQTFLDLTKYISPIVNKNFHCPDDYDSSVNTWRPCFKLSKKNKSFIKINFGRAPQSINELLSQIYLVSQMIHKAKMNELYIDEADENLGPMAQLKKISHTLDLEYQNYLALTLNSYELIDFDHKGELIVEDKLGNNFMDKEFTYWPIANQSKQLEALNLDSSFSHSNINNLRPMKEILEELGSENKRYEEQNLLIAEDLLYKGNQISGIFSSDCFKHSQCIYKLISIDNNGNIETASSGRNESNSQQAMSWRDYWSKISTNILRKITN